ncbi:MAG: SdpI family protein [Dehalococcoidia bacterium]|nr:SdpI family protein [Dehalococcoidia bacterium]
MRLNRWLLLFFLVAFYALALVLYNRMPDPMTSHWNAQGAADGYISRFWGMFLFPIMTTGLALLLLAIPQIDPLKENIRRFRTTYDWAIVFIVGFMLYIYGLTLLWNLGTQFDFMQLLVPAAAILYFFLGVLLGKAKRNYLIGIRTPWTLNNEDVWNRTHKIGGLIFKAAALFTLPGVFWPGLAVWFVVGPILLAAIVLIAASYIIHQRVTGR